MFGESPLNESLATLSRFFVSDSTMQETLDRVTDLCQRAIPAAEFVGITMMVEGRARTAIYTDPTSPEIDQAQYDSGEGPCLDAYRHNKHFGIADTDADGPWPQFRKAAAAHGIRSTLSLPLSGDRRAVGALNLYSKAVNGFSAHDEQTGQQFAAHAAVVLANATAYWDAKAFSERLDQSMQARAIIEQAKGILMGAQRCTGDQAFDLLVKASQRENVKLRDIATRLVDNAANPEPLPA
jgi:GAF domain-containing protein